MSTEHFMLVLKGTLKDGRSPDQAALILSKAFGIPLEKGKGLFQGKPTPLSKKLDRKLAEKILHYLQEAGAECELEAVRDAPQWSLVEIDTPPAKADENRESILIEASPPFMAPHAGKVAPKPPEPQPETAHNPPLARRNPTQPPVDQPRTHHRPVLEKPAQEEESPPVKNAGKLPFGPRLLAMLAVLLAALAAAAYFFIFSQEAGNNPSPQGNPGQASPSAALDPANLNDPAVRDSETSLTRLKLQSLAQSVRVWMVQFGGGYETDQVTLPRLQRDMGVSDEDLTDTWGTKIRYLPVENEFSITSAGPDRAFGTADDVTVRQKR